MLSLSLDCAQIRCFVPQARPSVTSKGKSDTSQMAGPSKEVSSLRMERRRHLRLYNSEEEEEEEED